MEEAAPKATTLTRHRYVAVIVGKPTSGKLTLDMYIAGTDTTGMASGSRPTALLRVLVFGKEITSFCSCKSRRWRTACYTLPPAEDKTSARELGAVLCLRIRLGAAAIHHASLTPSEFKGKVAKGLLFLRVFWRFIHCHLPGQWEMFTCLLCQLSSGSSDMITTLECSEMLSGSSYLLIWSPGHLITVKKKKHHQSTTQLQIIWGVGPEGALAFSFPPAIAACNCINYICSSQKPYLMWGQGRLRVRGFAWGYTCKQKSGHGRRASFHHHHQSPSTRAGGWGVSAQPLSVPRTGKLIPYFFCTSFLLYLIIAVPYYCCTSLLLYLVIAVPHYWCPAAAHPTPQGCHHRFRPRCANTAAPFLHADNNSATLTSRSREPCCGHPAATTDGGPRSG